MKRSYALAALLGALAVLGFAPFALWPLPILSLTGLIGLWAVHPTPRAAALLGFYFGLGHFLAGVSWVYVSLHTFGMMPAPLAAIATLAFCLILALYPGVVGFLCARWDVKRPAVALVMVPCMWASCEWLRGWFLSGFPWLSMGYSQIDTPLAGFAPIVGVYGISLLMVLLAALLFLVVRGSARQRIAAVAIGIVVYGAGALLMQTKWTTPAGAGLDVALLQGNVPQEMKFVPGRFESTLALYGRLIEQTNARLIVLPETAIPQFPEGIPATFIDRVKAHAQSNQGDVLIGLPTGDRRTQYFNSIVSIGTAPSQVYSKQHLVPFGEYIPPGFGWIEKILAIPLSDFTPGPATQTPLAVAGEQVAINICYEDAFGGEIIRQLPAATLLVNVSNVAWFGDSLAPLQHLQIARMRALEAGRYMLRATNSGVTAIIDERGRLVQALPAFTEGVLVGLVQGFQGATPYARLGDWIVLVALALALIVIAWRPRARNR
ncbi:MAG: apolipoprotein N-acyltransferase [Betaproteobacteria bacterium]|nr:apolipoprotein N-acyltransferase [Betaproteobacteria bacterium]